MSDYPPPDPRSSSSGEIPRRGYDRRRDSTGTLRPPSTAGMRPEDLQPGPPSQSYGYYGAPQPPPGTPPPPRRGRERLPRDSGLYLPWWSLVILIVVVGASSFGLMMLVASLGGAALAEPTPQIIVVTSAIDPAAAQQRALTTPTELPTQAPTAGPAVVTAAPTRTLLPRGCLLNQEVIVTGTGGVGLNLRDEPGGEVSFIAKEGERMLVIDGPIFFSDLEWCQVRSTAQSSSFGWAALDFLLPVEALEE